MFGFSAEHLVILVIILLIFGPKRLPDLGHSIGRTLKNFKDGMNGLADEGKKTAEQIEAKPAAPAAPSTAKTEEKVADKEPADKA